MAIKTFANNEVLSASDTNTFLANAGLVYITGGALSGAATDFQGCFTSTYRNYRIVIDNLSINASTDFCWQGLVGANPQTGNNYWHAGVGLSAGNAAYNTNGQNINPGRTLATISGANTPAALTMDFYRPQENTVTIFTAQFASFQADDFRMRNGAGGFNPSTQLTGIRLLSAGGQTISGNVQIFGYRQA